jgi:CRP/FNR family transcriptional regulator, cyclic AMP receptor protein
MDNFESVLAEHPFFCGISEDFIPDLAIHADLATFETGDLLFKEGAVADKFYLIIKGKVAVYSVASNNDAITIQTLGDGEILGWSWITKPYLYKFSAVAIAQTEVVVLNAKEVRIECELDAELGYELMKLMVHAVSVRLEQTRLQLLDTYALNEQ